MQYAMRVVLALIFISTYLYGISEACECGRATSSRVINGTPEKYSNFPWMARFYMFLMDSGVVGHCGASMISTRYAVTAGHCTVPPYKDEYRFQLVLGELPNILKYRESNVKRIIVKSSGRGVDIAVIETTMDMNVPPICLPPPKEMFADVPATLLGYGKTETGDVSPVMLAGNFTVPSNEQCRRVMKYVSIQDSEICGGNYMGGPALCTGDSGGPLMYYDPKDNRWFLIGVVHGSYHCLDTESYGLFTRVTSFLDWIQMQTNNSGCQAPILKK